MFVEIEGKEIKISNPDKLLWPEQGIRKIDYIRSLLELSEYLLAHTQKRLLTTIRYPNGVQGKSFFQKNIPDYSPVWLPTKEWHENNYLVLDSKAALVWLGNQAALEFHIPFNLIDQEFHPTALVFDLDPSEKQTFENVAEVALLIKKELTSLKITSYLKTSGASGLQIYIPTGGKYDYDSARKINEFFASYFSQKYPERITIERNISRRGQKLYFDYLQMWQGKTIISPYSPRATKHATVAAPLEWNELEKGVKPENFNLLNIQQRLKLKGDLFSPLLNSRNVQNLDFILEKIE